MLRAARLLVGVRCDAEPSAEAPDCVLRRQPCDLGQTSDCQALRLVSIDIGADHGGPSRIARFGSVAMQQGQQLDSPFFTPRWVGDVSRLKSALRSGYDVGVPRRDDIEAKITRAKEFLNRVYWNIHYIVGPAVGGTRAPVMRVTSVNVVGIECRLRWPRVMRLRWKSGWGSPRSAAV